jgi:hypothetical protein
MLILEGFDMNFWAKFLNRLTNIFIFIGIAVSVIIGVNIIDTGTGVVNILFGLFIIAVGIVIVLEAAAGIKIIIYASEDLSQCREYLRRMSQSQTFSVSAKDAAHLSEKGERWFCKECKQPNPMSIINCRACGQKN